MAAPRWFEKLTELAERYPEAGVLNDLPALSKKELRGVYRWLLRYAHGKKSV
jgi:hypothetical protein